MRINTARIVIVFILLNLLLVSVAAVILAGPFDELTRVSDALGLAEKRYAQKEYNLTHRDEHLKALQALEEAEGERVLLPYGQMAEALAHISRMARQYDLEEITFESGEPVIYGAEMYGAEITEIGIFAVYEGAYEDISSLLQALMESGGYYRFERLTVTFSAEGVASVRLNLYIYGMSYETDRVRDEQE